MSMPGKGSKSPPAPPDPNVVSAAQTKSNEDTASYNAGLSHVNQNTPYGSLTYKQTGTNPDGSPQYQSNISFTPLGQQIFDQQQKQQKGLSNVAGGMIDSIGNTTGKPLDTSGVPDIQSSVSSSPIQSSLDYSSAPAIPGGGDFSKDAQNYQNAYNERMQPQLQRESNALDSKLANQGIMPGSEAYNTEHTLFGQHENDANAQGVMGGYQTQQALNAQQLAAHQAGTTDINNQGQFANTAQQQGFNQGMQGAGLANSANAQSLAEAIEKKELPLNEYNALSSASQIQTPSFNSAPPVSMAPTNVAGNYYNSYAGLQNNYNQSVGSNNSMMSGLFNLGGQLGASYLMGSGSSGGGGISYGGGMGGVVA